MQRNNSHQFVMSSFVAALVLAGAAAHASAQASVTISLNPNAPSAFQIPGDFAGLSFEQQLARYDFNGGTDIHSGFLQGGNTVYNQFIKTLGIHNVRVGANSGEQTQYPYPTDLDGTHVNDFAAQAQATLIWQLPIESKYNVATYSTYAENLMANKAGKNQTFRTVFEGGNEPDVNGLSYATWQSRFDGYFNALVGPIGANLFMTGPSAAFNQSYADGFATDATYHNGNQSKIRYITQHWYPKGGTGDYSNLNAAIDALLSQTSGQDYTNFYNNFGVTAVNNGYLGRLGESNSMAGGGYHGASDSLVGALWSLDYLCYFAQNTMLEGIDFHNANGPAAYNTTSPVGIASSYTLQGVGYGILAYSKWNSGNGNAAIPQTTTNSTHVNFANYSNLQTDGSIRMALINKTHQSSTSTNNDVTVTVVPNRSYGHAQIMYLTQINGDPTQVTGIILGGQSVSNVGVWTGNYTQTITPVNGNFTISVPHTTAALVRLY